MVAALLLVAVSLGLSNLAASIGIGVGGVDRRTRLRVGIIFGSFEAAMPAVGLLIGHGLAASLGHATNWLAAGLLILVGGAGVVGGIRGRTVAGTQSPTVPAWRISRGFAAERRIAGAARTSQPGARSVVLFVPARTG